MTEEFIRKYGTGGKSRATSADASRAAPSLNGEGAPLEPEGRGSGRSASRQGVEAPPGGGHSAVDLARIPGDSLAA